MNPPLTAIILQGGGALGAYQAGVVEQLITQGIGPDWVIGTSIGAINGALIAGNRPEHRLTRLHEFWNSVAVSEFGLPDTVSSVAPWLDIWSPRGWPGALNPALMMVISRGVDGFFEPRPGAALNLSSTTGITEASFYNTAPLRDSLIKYVDFEVLNSGATRLSVCAVDVETAELRVFDTAQEKLGPEHIMASGALPPAFPAVAIEGRYYWDGGVYSNSPLGVLLEDRIATDALVFMVDVWDPTEGLPHSLTMVMDRVKTIQYASRANEELAARVRQQELERAIRTLAALLPDANRGNADLQHLISLGNDRAINVVRLIMKTLPRDDYFKDVDFTRLSIDARWQAGMQDAARALLEKAWLDPAAPRQGLVIHELSQGESVRT